MPERPEVWQHLISKFMEPYLGKVRKPKKRYDALMELIAGALSSGESGVTFNSWVCRFIQILEMFSIDPKGDAGQFMLRELVEDIKREAYGEYDEWTWCGYCGEEYHLRASMKAANRIIAGHNVCDECFAEEAYPEPEFPLHQSADEKRDEWDWLASPLPTGDDFDEDDKFSADSSEAEEDKPDITPEEANKELRKLLELDDTETRGRA